MPRVIALTLLLAVSAAALHLYHRGWWDRGDEAPQGEMEAAASVEAAPEAGPPAEALQDPGGAEEGPASDTPGVVEALGNALAAPEAAARHEADVLADAVRAFNAARYDRALRLFTEALQKDKRALTGMGLSCYKLGDYAGAVRHLEAALKETGESFPARKFLALAYYKQDEVEKSARNARAALSIKDDPELRAFYEKAKKECEVQGGFLGEDSEHFKILYDGYRHGAVDRKILRFLEEAYRGIGSQLDHFPDRSITVMLYSDKEFKAVTERPDWVRGFYDGKIRLPVKGLEESEEAAVRRIVFHEYVHALVHSITHGCPKWMNEGLAEYFSAGEPKSIGQVIPLSRLEKNWPTEGGRATWTAYRESHAAVACLIERHGGLYGMKEFLTGLGGGMALEDAFRSAFGIEYEAFTAGWGREAEAGRR